MTLEQNGIYYIRGIASVTAANLDPETGQVKCDQMQYAVFTDVAKYLPWITEKTTMEGSLAAPLSRYNSNS